jgi:hypothetical protein
MHPWPRLPINEVIPVAPSPAYVWIGGSWGWGGGRYNWRPGRWAMPPRPGYGWHEGAGTMAWRLASWRWPLGAAPLRASAGRQEMAQAR